MQTFKEVISTPEAWFRQAWQMFEASKVNFSAFKECKPVKSERELHKQVGLMDASKLCLSLSIENAFKGAYVYICIPDLKNNKLDPNHFHKKSHDLVDLAKRLNLELTTEELKLLARFSSFINWAAKYSAPLNENAYIQFEGENKITFPRDFEFAENLIDKLQIQSGFNINSGW